MIQISFGYSSSQNYLLALTMAAKAGEFHWTGEDKAIHYQCDYDFADLPKAVNLWDLVGGWKSASFKVEGQELDRGGIGRVKFVYDCWKNGKDLPDHEAYCRAPHVRRDETQDEIQRALTWCRHTRILRAGFTWLEHGYVTLGGSWAIDKEWIRGQTVNELARTRVDVCPMFNGEALEKALAEIPAEFNASWMWQEPVTDPVTIRPPGDREDCKVIEFKPQR